VTSAKRILLILGGGIAAYKILELIRRLREEGCTICAVLTDAASQFVTPLSVASLTGEKIYQNLFDLTDETEIGHIQLSRDADLIVVAPATADLMAKMSAGLATDLATTLLLATDKPVLIAPAMNVRMWEHAATQRNLKQLKKDGIGIIGPNDGDMACGEYGPGRMAEPAEIKQAILAHFDAQDGRVTKLRQATPGTAKPLEGYRALVTAGPTWEPIDPVRYLGNRSSGKQGYAIAQELAEAGAETILVSGPVALNDPPGVKTIRIETAEDMLAACETALPVDVAICAAAVADWRAASQAPQKLKKNGGAPQDLPLKENPDILKSISVRTKNRPPLVVGFAAETENLIQHATQKRKSKGCDWMVANSVAPGTDAMGGDTNQVHLITGEGAEAWPQLPKSEVAHSLVTRIGHFLRAHTAAPRSKTQGAKRGR
jgi:phosphopantothenoylcysteine decarboxylase/phosphopantothenate--cysteine ligase